ncbi:MAG: GNAT family N-acetyltransferase, partial [Thermaerobacterales bacterium]
QGGYLEVAGPEDAQDLMSFWHRLSEESLTDRFLYRISPSRAASGTSPGSGADRRQTLSVVMLRGADRPEIIAVGSYAADSRPGEAEMAIAVEDAWQGRGIGTLLLERLAMEALRNGIHTFRAITGVDNRRMLQVLRNSGFRVQEQSADGVRAVTFSVQPDPASISRQEMRDRAATVASLTPLLMPRAIAVIGASRNPAAIGYRVLQNLVSGGFQGPVYPVNPHAAAVGSIHAYPSVEDIPGPVDMAVIAVPSDRVLETVDACATKQIEALVVISAGFAETGEAGRQLQDRLAAKVRGHGMRMVGPNCLGLLNTDPQVSMNASFAPAFPAGGRVAMSSQSGALGLAILQYAEDVGLGMSSFISVGNKADVSGNDLLQYWEEDENTDLILLYLESFGNPRRFARIARRVGRSKPILAVKGGRTAAGLRAAGSHTAALAASDVAVDALFQQSGVIRADTLDDMFDTANLLAHQPLPAGKRVAVLTNAGGPGILCADACESAGLVLPPLSDATQAKLAEFLPAAASLENPVDMIASAGIDAYRRAIPILLADSEVDSLVVIHIPVGMSDVGQVAEALYAGVDAARGDGVDAAKPVLACVMEPRGRPSAMNGPEGQRQIPNYRFPESAARALARVTEYAVWRNAPEGMLVDLPGIDLSTVKDIVAAAGPAGGWLSAGDTRRVLTAMGMPVLPGGLARSEDDAAALAVQVGFPVAVKLTSSTMVHKTEFGGVRLNLNDDEEVRQAYRDIKQRIHELGRLDEMEGVLIQPMVTGGIELVIGSTEDPNFGPLVAFGLGGIHVEILSDVIFRITPLTDLDADRMIRGISGYPLLKGYRGHPPADIDAVRDLLLRVARLVEEVPEIAELDLNPVMALGPGQGCRIVDARVSVRQKRSG